MKRGDSQTSDFTYSGTDNLEAMAAAKNYNAFLVRTLAKHLRGRREILDFGAGIGYFAGKMRELGFSMTCVEPDPALAGQLKDLGFDCTTSLRAAGEERFAGAYALNVLEHIENDDAVIGQLHQVLAQGGLLVIYVPAFQILFSSMDRKVGHLRRYKARALMRKIRAQGFHVLHCSYADVLGFFASLLFRILGNPRGDLDPLGLRAFDRYAFPLSRWLDRITSPFVGKNLLIVAKKRTRVR
jgi:SAM-dependent methyltransferase